MTNINLSQFGVINFNKLEEYYNLEIDFNKNKLIIDLNFENKTICKVEVEKINLFLKKIKEFEVQNRNFIEKDFKYGGESSDYINFFLYELEEEEFLNIIDEYSTEDLKVQVLNKLKLIRVGLYPDGKYGADYYGVFDYSICVDGEPCNQLLGVKINQNGKLDHITWQS